jgi:prenyltransferase beta subunit
MRRPLLVRFLGAVLAAVLIVPVVTSSPAVAAAATTADRTALGTYVISQLSGAQSYQPFGPGFADTGLSIDGALALSAAGGHDATVARIRGFVAGQVRTFADPADADHAFSGGGVAKIALLAEVTGADPHSFGGFDLIKALSEHVCTASQVAADRTNCPAVGVYRGVTSTFGQSLGLLAQARSGGASAAAAAALVSTRCPDGSFRSILPAVASCAAGGGDVDSTAMAVQALAAAGGHTSEVDAGITWIAAAQVADGGFPGTAGDNTNSTGLAIQAMALHSSTYSARIAKAQSFLAARQNADGGLGINTTSDGAASDVRASTQGLNGLVGTPFSTLSRAVPTGTPGRAQSSAAARGATYLSSSAVLRGGTHVESGGYVDYGLTADIAIALAATGSTSANQTRLKAIVTYLRAHVAAYADPAGVTPGFPGPFSGSLAKLALLAEITGQDPHAFGGYDLLGLLRSHQCAKANAAGTCTAAGDFFQAFSGASQAIGVLALARAGSVSATDPAVVRLRQLQCADGGFSSTLPPRSPCVSEVDTTGFALQALALVSDDSTSTTSPAADALVRGQDYVLSVRRSDGSFPGAAGNNTNSTALAVQALLASPGTDRASTSAPAGPPAPGGLAIREALSFLTGEQNDDGGFGINVDAAASDARASAQVVPALALAALDTLSHPITLAAFITPRPTSVSPSRPPAVSSSSPAASASASVRASRSQPVAVEATGAVATLANTGMDRGTLNLELLAALVLLAGGGSLIALGRQRRPRGRHQ